MNKPQGKRKPRAFLNPVDILALLALLAVVAGVLWKVGIEPAVSSAKEKAVSVRYTVRVRNVHKRMESEIRYQVSRDNQLFTDNGYIDDAYLVSIETEPYTQPVTTDEGETVMAVDPARIDFLYTIEAQATREDDIFKVGPQILKIGLNHYVKTRRVEYLGSIESIEFIEANETNETNDINDTNDTNEAMETVMPDE